MCLDTLPNNTLLIIATIIPWTITKCSVVTLCIREVQRMSCVTKNLCNVTRLNLIKLGGFGCENWMGNFGLINFPLYLRSYLKRSPLVHQCISFHPENYPSIPLVNLSFRFPRARFQTLFRKISNHRLLLLNQLQKLERIPSDFHAIRLSSSCSPLDPPVDTPDGREWTPKIFETPRGGEKVHTSIQARRLLALNKRSFSRIGAGRPEGGRARFRGKNRVSGNG